MKSIQVLLFALFFSSISFSQVELAISNEEKGTSYFYHNFGKIFTGSTQYVRYDVKNKGTAPLKFLKAQIGGSFDFSAYHSCKNGLDPQKSCWFEIRYWPLFEGWDTGRFIISFDQDNNIVVDLNGEAYKL
ncbi:MAG: hypothetical protein ACK5V3_02540 [Bdellovibrionales bacterium]